VEAVPGAGQLNWAVSRHVGDAGAFHALTPDARRQVLVFEPGVPALVLGSAQPDGAVDRRVAEALGIAVVRRRSGGGAVLMMPGEIVWIDLVIGAGDPLWDDDVGRSMHWVGDAWARALGRGEVHRGPMRRTAWSAEVCFAGTGPGEVVDATGAKLVGISQRRTRHSARFQTMLHRRWRPELVAALVSPPRPLAAELAALTATADTVPDALIAALP